MFKTEALTRASGVIVSLFFCATIVALALSPRIEQSSGDLAAELRNTASDFVEDHEIPGLAAAVLQDNETLLEYYVGDASIEHGVSMNPDVMLRVYSTTKVCPTCEYAFASVFARLERDTTSRNFDCMH